MNYHTNHHTFIGLKWMLFIVNEGGLNRRNVYLFLKVEQQTTISTTTISIILNKTNINKAFITPYPIVQNK